MGAAQQVMAAQNITGSGGTIFQQNAAATTAIKNIGNAANNYFQGQGDYNPGANISVSRIDVPMTKVSGSIIGKTFICRIYTQDGADALTTLHGTSAGITGVDSWAATPVSFIFSPPIAISNGGNYAIVITALSADASNYAGIDVSLNGQISGDSFGYTSAQAFGTFSNNDVKYTIWIP